MKRTTLPVFASSTSIISSAPAAKASRAFVSKASGLLSGLTGFRPGDPELTEPALLGIGREFLVSSPGCAGNTIAQAHRSPPAVRDTDWASTPWRSRTNRPLSVGRPLPGQQDLFVQHPGLLFRLFEDHLLVEHRRAVEHEKVEGGDDGADEHNEFGAERKPGGERSGHDLSALGRNLACC